MTAFNVHRVGPIYTFYCILEGVYGCLLLRLYHRIFVVSLNYQQAPDFQNILTRALLFHCSMAEMVKDQVYVLWLEYWNRRQYCF